MPYLIQNDFLKQIQPGNLNAVIGSNYAIINSWLLEAQEKATSYLVQKYDVSQEFTNTNVWNGANTYQAANRVYLDAPLYSPTATYAIGAYCTYQPAGQPVNFYIATAASAAIPFNPANWGAPIPQYTIFYAAFPYPVFNVYCNYNVGDIVFWKNNIYTAEQATTINNMTYVLQYGSYANIPLNNYFPDAPGNAQWTLTTTGYTVPANTAITNTTYWVQGDNRSQQMVAAICDMVLYRAYPRISPMNIPNHIGEKYKEAIMWLKGAAVGETTPNLIKLQPKKGNRIRYGGDIRLNKRY
jgi:hypothetical protein